MEGGRTEAGEISLPPLGPSYRKGWCGGRTWMKSMESTASWVWTEADG